MKCEIGVTEIYGESGPLGDVLALQHKLDTYRMVIVDFRLPQPREHFLGLDGEVVLWPPGGTVLTNPGPRLILKERVKPETPFLGGPAFKYYPPQELMTPATVYGHIMDDNTQKAFDAYLREHNVQVVGFRPPTMGELYMHTWLGRPCVASSTAAVNRPHIVLLRLPPAPTSALDIFH